MNPEVPSFDLLLKDHHPDAGVNACRMLAKLKSSPWANLPVIGETLSPRVLFVTSTSAASSRNCHQKIPCSSCEVLTDHLVAVLAVCSDQDSRAEVLKCFNLGAAGTGGRFCSEFRKLLVLEGFVALGLAFHVHSVLQITWLSHCGRTKFVICGRGFRSWWRSFPRYAIHVLAFRPLACMLHRKRSRRYLQFGTII